MITKIVYLISSANLLLFLAINFFANPARNSVNAATSLLANSNRFDANILQAITERRTRKNVVISPVSIQISLALALLGAEGETAKQIRRGLRIPTTMNKIAIARNYAAFLKQNFQVSPHISNDAPTLRMANRIYVNERLSIVARFNELAKKTFEAVAVPMKFDEPAYAVNSMNKWIEKQTNGKVKDLLHENQVSGDVVAILVNVIYFKAKWDKPFSLHMTEKMDFKMADKRTVEVDMMYNERQYYNYANLPNLNATALEMRYKDSHLAMLIILPNKVDGLPALERLLARVDLRKVVEKMQMKEVNVYLPRFHIEFDIDLKQPLIQLGMQAMFDSSVDFSGLYSGAKSNLDLDVVHKAVLDVNEAGSEAAATSFFRMTWKSFGTEKTNFVVNHPFIYAIRNDNVMFFAGHVAQF